MSNDGKSFFDLQVLLQQGDLNMREFAADAPEITAGAYFSKLAEFLWISQIGRAHV